MQIERLDLADRRGVRSYIEFPFRLYRRCPQWVPPFAGEARAQLDPARHPFYEHSQAAFFLAWQGREIVGRVAVLDNTRHNAHHGTRAAFFYQFESIDDRAVSRALVDAACDWSRQRGLDRLWGPKGFSHLDGQGILVEGFEHRPAMGVPYNLPYYGALLEDAGFIKKLDFISWRMDRSYRFPERILELAAKIRERRGLCSVVFRRKEDLAPLIPKVISVYNESFGEVQGFVPISPAEGEAIGRRILAVADPQLISLLMKEDEPVGFVLAYPDLSSAIQRCRGRIWPLGWLYLMREFKKTRWVNFNGAAILPAYRGIGGNALLYAEMYRILIHHSQYDFVDLVQVQETNTRMMQEMAAMQVPAHKRHRVYERVVG